MTICAKVLFIVIGAFLQFNSYSVDLAGITIFLVSIVLASLSLIKKNRIYDEKKGKPSDIIPPILFCIASIFIPEMKVYYPLMVIDSVIYRTKAPGIIICLGILLELPNPAAIRLLLLSLTALLVEYVIAENDSFREESKKLRDTSRENELLNAEKTRRLIEKQDTEIHMATLKERNRIAREIHDNVGHLLTRSILQIGAIKTINRSPILNEPLDGLHETLNAAMSNIRTSVHDLHDESLNLESAVRELSESAGELDITLHYDMEPIVPRDIKYCFLSIIKEAVNNTLRHGNATKMQITIQEHPAFYRLFIQDNGSGTVRGGKEGIGLTNMRDRVRKLDGNIRISSDDGFQILVSILKERRENK